jgi:hypothetical protein
MSTSRREVSSNWAQLVRPQDGTLHATSESACHSKRSAEKHHDGRQGRVGSRVGGHAVHLRPPTSTCTHKAKGVRESRPRLHKMGDEKGGGGRQRLKTWTHRATLVRVQRHQRTPQPRAHTLNSRPIRNTNDVTNREACCRRYIALSTPQGLYTPCRTWAHPDTSTARVTWATEMLGGRHARGPNGQDRGTNGGGGAHDHCVRVCVSYRSRKGYTTTFARTQNVSPSGNEERSPCTARAHGWRGLCAHTHTKKMSACQVDCSRTRKGEATCRGDPESMRTTRALSRSLRTSSSTSQNQAEGP